MNDPPSGAARARRQRLPVDAWAARTRLLCQVEQLLQWRGGTLATPRRSARPAR